MSTPTAVQPDLIITEPADASPASLPCAVPNPQWKTTFDTALGNQPGGYAFVVRKGGAVVASGCSGYARMSQDSPETLWTTDTRCNLASVSKTITATAIFRMIQDGYITSVNDCFLPYLTANLLPGLQPAAGVDTVTIGELLTMTSRLPENGDLRFPGGLVPFLKDYLTNNAVIPGQLYVYSNANFTILEGVVTAVCLSKGLAQKDYVEYVQQVLLQPLGIDPANFSPVPPPENEATLYYSTNPTANGHYNAEFELIGAGGWVADAYGVCLFLDALFAGKIINPKLVDFMTGQLMGWYFAPTCFGRGNHHNGGLVFIDSSGNKLGLSTGVVHFQTGQSAVLLINCPYPNIIPLMIQAFNQ